MSEAKRTIILTGTVSAYEDNRNSIVDALGLYEHRGIETTDDPEIDAFFLQRAIGKVVHESFLG